MQRLASNPSATERRKTVGGNTKTLALLTATYEHARELQPFTSRDTSSPPLPAIDFVAVQPAAATAQLELLLRHGQSPSAGVAAFDNVAQAYNEAERAREEVAYVQADLLVYLQALVRKEQELKARERSTRAPATEADVFLGEWDVASHRPTATHGDPAVLLGVRRSIFVGLARGGVLLGRLELVFAFVFSSRFKAEALGSLRGNQATRHAWAGQGGPVPEIKAAAFGQRRRAATAAAVATGAAVTDVYVAAAAAPAAHAAAAAAARIRKPAGVKRRRGAAARDDGEYAYSGSSDSD